MTVSEFINKYNGKGIDFDGYYGFQCMDLVEQYNKEVVSAPRLGGNAIDVWTNYPKAFYDKVVNSPSNIPLKGDVVIWNQGVGQFGHIGVFYAGDVYKFQSFDQNWPISSICHVQPHNYNNVLGWLHPKTIQLPIDYKKVCMDIRFIADTNEPDNKKVEYIKEALRKVGI